MMAIENLARRDGFKSFCRRRAPQGSPGLGDVRLCQLGLHHGRDHRRVQRLFRRGDRGQRTLGDFCLDGGVVGLIRFNSADRTRDRGLRRPACRKEALARPYHGWLRDGDRFARVHRARNARARGGVVGVLQLLLRLRGEPRRRVSARARSGRIVGTGIGLGLESGLSGRAFDSRPVPGLRHLGAGSRPGSATVCARHDADHCSDLRSGKPADFLGAQGARTSDAGRRRRKPDTGDLRAARANRAPSRALSGPRPVPRMHRLLSSGDPDGHRTRRDLRGAGARLHDEGYDRSDPGGQRDSRGRRVRLWQHPGSTRACADHCSYSCAVDRNDLDSLVRIRVRTFLGGRQSCRTVPRFLAVGRPSAGGLPEPR